jgi:hypothetical protein
MQQEAAIASVSHAIQLSVAPVFLLTAVGAMLSVMTSRLARIVDRARVAEATHAEATGEMASTLHTEVRSLARRATLINRAITLYTVTALCICSVIAALFIAAFLSVDASRPIAVLFVGAMMSFIAALLYFLREVFIATVSLRIGPR